MPSPNAAAVQTTKSKKGKEKMSAKELNSDEEDDVVDDCASQYDDQYSENEQCVSSSIASAPF